MTVYSKLLQGLDVSLRERESQKYLRVSERGRERESQKYVRRKQGNDTPACIERKGKETSIDERILLCHSICDDDRIEKDERGLETKVFFLISSRNDFSLLSLEERNFHLAKVRKERKKKKERGEVTVEKSKHTFRS